MSFAGATSQDLRRHTGGARCENSACNSTRSPAAYWPTSAELVAPVLNDTPKVVFSKTLSSADWPESRIARGDTAEEIARLKAEPGGEIVAHGGVR